MLKGDSMPKDVGYHGLEKFMHEEKEVKVVEAEHKLQTIAIPENFNQDTSNQRMKAAKPWKPKGRK